MKEKAIDKVLSDQKFSDEEKNVFLNILRYAKATMENNKENLRPYINNQINEVVKNEIQKHKI